MVGKSKCPQKHPWRVSHYACYVGGRLTSIQWPPLLPTIKLTYLDGSPLFLRTSRQCSQKTEVRGRRIGIRGQ